MVKFGALKNQSESQKSPRNLFLKKGRNPVFSDSDEIGNVPTVFQAQCQGRYSTRRSQ